MLIDGRCHCGAVAFQAEIDPTRVSICHCTDCQTLTGSPFRVTVLTERARLRLTGAPKVYVRLGDSGAKRLQHFCPDCGTPLFASGDPDNGVWGIRWGSIRQRDELAPARQIWRRSAVPWLGAVDAVPSKPTE